jgi:hypothetical protein
MLSSYRMFSPRYERSWKQYRKNTTTEPQAASIAESTALYS